MQHRESQVSLSSVEVLRKCPADGAISCRAMALLILPNLTTILMRTSCSGTHSLQHKGNQIRCPSAELHALGAQSASKHTKSVIWGQSGKKNVLSNSYSQSHALASFRQVIQVKEAYCSHGTLQADQGMIMKYRTRIVSA